MEQSKYEQLKQAIQQANPEIMELKFGCEIRSHFGQGKVVSLLDTKEGEAQWLTVLVEDRLHDIQVVAQQILGRPIRLADVLLAIDAKEHKKAAVGSDGEILSFKHGKSYWNLKDDNLDHQSEETKQLLINLLVNE